MHELCVLTMIFRLLLMKFTMTGSECVLLLLYHNMPKPVYIFINHFTAWVHCFVQRILRAPVERVPAHFSNVFFTPAWFLTIMLQELHSVCCFQRERSLSEAAFSCISKGRSLPTVDSRAHSRSLLWTQRWGCWELILWLLFFSVKACCITTFNHFDSVHTNWINQ